MIYRVSKIKITSSLVSRECKFKQQWDHIFNPNVKTK